MIEIIKTKLDLCTGCNRCVRECPMETANVTYQDSSGCIKSEIDYERCIHCGRCVSACKHEARYFTDDTERFFDDLSKGVAISIMAAPSIRTNISEYKKLFTYLKRLGVNKIYDVSLGADICIWAHIKYITEGGAAQIITQPCPPIVRYCEMYRHDLLKKLSPIHSPMACTSIFMREYQGIGDSIAALSPCMAKTVEFADTKLAGYNVTFAGLHEYLKRNNILLPDEETGFDHDNSGLGMLFPAPGGLKENIEHFMGKRFHIAKAEGFGVYDKLDRYAETPDEFLPDIYDVLSCSEGCNKGTATSHDRCVFEISKIMDDDRKSAAAGYGKFADTLDLSRFIREYRPVETQFKKITDADIGKAFELLGKTDYEKYHVDCYACGSDTCYGMARKIALNVNIPENCIVKSKDDAKLEHDNNLQAHTKLVELEKMREADERMRLILEVNANENEFQLTKLNMVIKATKIGLWEMEVVDNDPINPNNTIIWSDELLGMIGYEKASDLPGIISTFNERVHPDDFHRHAKAIVSHMMDKTGQTPYDEEFRLMKKNGEYGHFRATGETLRSSDGTATYMVGALIDMTEIKELIREAERQRVEAEAANIAKSQFLSHMSHELRTPMNAVLGAAEIQLQKGEVSPDAEEAFTTIYNSGNVLLNIINDILDLSKIEAGKLEIVPVKYDIPSLIFDTIQLNLLRYDSKTIEFYLEIDENTPIDMYGDELRIKQILNNIVSNAFKYTDKGKVVLSVSAETGVELSAADTERHSDCVLILKVSDTGQGMTEEQIEKLFDDYTRFNIEANRSTVGTGLGMSITKRFIDMMDGEIFVESTPDKGSTFIVRLPQRRIGTAVCGADAAGKLRSSSFQNAMKIKKSVSHDYMPYGSVLIVDDVESNLYVAKGMMMPYGLKIETVSSGFEAVEKIKNGGVYDIIFMDHMMPKMDGVEATRLIREMGYNYPVVALTANAVSGQSEMFLASGFDAFISKPIDIRELNASLNCFVRDRQQPEVIEAARREMRRHSLNSTLPKTMFMSDKLAAAVMRDIEDSLSELRSGGEDMKRFITTVHGLKSALANIGETWLSGAALRLEQAGKRGDKQAISNELPLFISALEELAEKYKRHETGKRGEAEASYEDMVFLRDKLSEIKAACERFGVKEAKAALAELRQRTWSLEIHSILDEILVCLLRGECNRVVLVVESAVKMCP